MKSKVFQVFPSFDEIKTDTDSDVTIIVTGEGKERFLRFSKPVRLVELSKLETLKIAFALLGRVGICEICGQPFRRKGSTYPHVSQRFCSKKCYNKWCRKTGGSLGMLRRKKEISRQRPSHDQLRKWGRKGGKRTQVLHPEVKANLKNVSH